MGNDYYMMNVMAFADVCIPAEEPENVYPIANANIHNENFREMTNSFNSNGLMTTEDCFYDVENLLKLDEVRRLKADNEVDVLFIDMFGQIKISRTGLLRNQPARYAANFANPSMEIFENIKTGERIYSVEISLGRKEATFFLSEKHAGDANFFLKKLRSVGGEFFLGKKCSKKDMAIQLWSHLLKKTNTSKIIPEKQGWFIDKNDEIHFFKGKTWKELKKLC